MSENQEIERLKALIDERDAELASLRKLMGDSPMATAMQMSGLAWWDWDVRRGLVQIHGLTDVFPNSPNGDFEISSGEWASMVDPADVDAFRNSLKNFDQSQANVWTHDCRILKMSGASRWMTFRGYVCEEDAAGKRLRMVGTIQDVHERKKDEIQLNLQREYLIAGSRVAALGAWVYNLDTKVVEWSEGVFAIHGLPVGDAPGIDKCMSFYVEADRERLREAMEHLRLTGEGYDLECELVDTFGLRKFVRVIGKREKLGGVPTRSLVGVIQDITDQSTMRRGMDAFFKMTPDLLGAIDFKSRPVTISPSWESLLGWTRYEMIRLGVECIAHDEDRNLMQSTIRKAIESGEVECVESRVVSKDGREFWLSWRMFADRSLSLVFISARDITDDHRIQDALVEAKEQADAANRAKSNFLATMSHELRTPLNPILGFSDLLLEEVEDPEQLEMLQAISEAGQKLTSALNEILDFTKVEAGKAVLAGDRFCIEDLMQTLASRARHQLLVEPRKVRLHSEQDHRIPKGARVVGDQTKIKGILSQLIENAIKFSDEGDVEIHSTLTLTHESRVLWHVDVKDRGIGIEPHLQERIFEPFLLGDDTYTRRHEGTGMGLALAKRHVELMGGQISVQSTPGVGSTFSFFLSLDLSQESTVEPAVEVPRAPSPEAGAIKVFMVEDNVHNIYYQRHLLESVGCKVSVVSSGEAAFASYQSNTYDLVLLDLHMSGVGGLDVLKWIRSKEAKEEARRVPVIIVSADVMATAKAVCLENGADEFVSKPVSRESLLMKIAKVRSA